MTTDLELLAMIADRLPLASLATRQQAAKLQKATTTAAGFLGLNLEQQAKMLLPIYAGLRHRLPTDTPALGAATAQWRAQLGYGSTTFFASTDFGTANGANGGTASPSATSFAADYKSLSRQGEVQREAINQARGFDDAMAIDTIWTLSALMRLEELIILFGNEAALPVAVASGNPSTLVGAATFAAGTWTVVVTALTGQGTGTNATSNSNTGESNISNFVDIVVPAGGCAYLDVSWPYVPGALGYKVYANHAAGGGHGMAALFQCDPATGLLYANNTGGTFLGNLGNAIVPAATGQTFVTVNHVQISAVVPNTQPIAVNADNSANSNVFEGVTAWCTKNTIYGQSLTGSAARNVVDQGGLPLTATSNGVKEFNSILSTQWTTNHTSPSLVLCSTNSIDSFGNKLASAGNNNQVRLDVYQERNMVVGGIYYGGYVNRYASAQAGMRTTVDIWAHPYMPDGTFLFLSEDVPATTIPYSRTGKTFALDVQQPYEYFELGRTQRSFPYDVWLNQTLKCYFPAAQAAIVGVRVDS